MKFKLTNNKMTLNLRGILIPILLISLIGSAQNATDNHRKYWYYKSRLNNDFVKVGLGQGEITIKKVVVQ